MNFNFFSKKRIFLDYAGGTPVLSSVLDEMHKHEKYFANPSGLYAESIFVKEKIKEFRGEIANYLNIQKNEIVFVSGGTEANNLAILGTFLKFKTDTFVPHIVTIATEHSSVLEVCKEIQKRGGEITVLPVLSDGRVSLELLEKSIKENTVLVTVSLANSEIGTIQPISQISKIIKEKKNKLGLPYLHTDASGASMYLSLDPNSLSVDMMSLDAGKLYGPKGIGLLYVKSGTQIAPVILGGGQERGLRSGTENLVAIAGFAKALELSQKDRVSESKRLESIREYAIDELLKNFPGSKLNGSRKHRLPNNINICFPKLDAEFVVVSLDLLGFSISYSSSCLTLKDDFSSYVVRALNTDGGEDCSKSSLRITLGRETIKSDIDKFIIALKKVVIK